MNKRYSTGTYRKMASTKVVKHEDPKPPMVMGVPEYVAWDLFMYSQLVVAAAAVYAPGSWTVDPVAGLLLWLVAECAGFMVALLALMVVQDS